MTNNVFVLLFSQNTYESVETEKTYQVLPNYKLRASDTYRTMCYFLREYRWGEMSGSLVAEYCNLDGVSFTAFHRQESRRIGLLQVSCQRMHRLEKVMQVEYIPVVIVLTAPVSSCITSLSSALVVY